MIDITGALRDILEAVGVCASGILDTSSATVPADSTRTEGDDQFNQCLFVPLNGTYAGIAKRITDYTGVGGIFTIDPADPFLGVTGLVPYIVVSRPGVPSSVATAIGDVTDAIPPMTAAPNNAYTIVQYCKAILERIGVTPADPDDALFTILGQRDSAATADDLSDIATTSAMAKLRRLLLRFSAAAFNPAMFGANPADVEAAFEAIATALGAEFDGTPNLYDVLATGWDSSAIAANQDGAIAERIEYVQQEMGYGTLSIEADAGSTATNIIDAAALTQAIADWWKGGLLLSINGQNAGQIRKIVTFTPGTDSVDVYPAFLNAPDAGDDFILISAARAWVWDQQPDVAVNTTAIVASETDIFDLNDSISSYMVNNLRLKAVDPGANTITVRLYELINDVSTVVQTFAITTANYGTYFSLMDMFGLAHLAGDDIQVTVQCDAGGPYAVTGQYQYAIAKNG